MAVSFNVHDNVFDSMRHSARSMQSTSFTSAKPQEVKSEPTAEIQQPVRDEVVVQEPEKKKSFVRKFKDGVAAVKKFFIGVGEYTKGTVKGLFFGGIAAGGVIGVDAIRGASKIIKDAKAGDIAGKAVKVLSTKGKVIAGAVGLAVLGYNLFKASLNASEKRANVDHRWGSGHNE